jgi:hypothetical protein
VTYGDALGWGLAVLLWLGITVGAVAVAFGIAVLGAFARDMFRK